MSTSLKQRIQPALNGSVPLSSLNKHTKEALSIFVYFRASAIVDSGDPARIKAEIDSVPEVVRGMVRDECRRLYKARFLDR